MRIPFGVYAGSDLKDVPLSYLHWVLTHVPVSVVMQDEISRVLKERGYHELGEDVMPFGKYAGFKFDEVPLNYLSWALANVELHPATVERMKKILADAGFPENGHLTPTRFGLFMKRSDE